MSATTDIAKLSLIERAQYYRRLGEDAARQGQAADALELRSAYEFLAEHWRKLADATEEAAGMKDLMLPGWELPIPSPARGER